MKRDARSLARRARAVKFADTQGALRRELGLAPTKADQLELEVAGARVNAAAAPCKTCGRWNYHLVDCAEVSR